MNLKSILFFSISLINFSSAFNNHFLNKFNLFSQKMITDNDLFNNHLETTDLNNNLNNAYENNLVEKVTETCNCLCNNDHYLYPLKMHIKNNYGEKIVRSTTSFLPMADSVGHKILAANDVIITSILNDKHLDYSFKKKIILTIIDISRHGDDMGSAILKGYHDLVDCLL